jgi:hypothetical protein
MTEAQRRAWDELRRATAYYETDWWSYSELTMPPVGDGYSRPIAAAQYLDAAGGSPERDTARLLEILAKIILELAGLAYPEYPDGDGDDGDPDEPDYPPPQPLPSKILATFKLKPAE